MRGEVKAITYTAKDGSTQEAVYYTGQALTKKREKFCALRAFGSSSREAYREAYYPDGNAPGDAVLSQMGSELSFETDIVLRIQELKRPVLKKYRQKFEYTLQKALEQCQVAWDIAFAQADAKALLKAIELQGKFMKLLTEQVNVNHRHGLLDDASTDALLEMRRLAEARTGKTKVIGIESVAEKRN